MAILKIRHIFHRKNGTERPILNFLHLCQKLVSNTYDTLLTSVKTVLTAFKSYRTFQLFL